MQQLGGYATAITEETAKLIESSVGKLTYVHNGGDVQKIRFDEPLPFAAVNVHCRKELLRHMSTFYHNLSEPSMKGYTFENQIPIVIADVMGEFAPLENLLTLPKGLEHLGEREFRLISVHTEAGEYVVSTVSPKSGASPQLVYKVKRATDLLEALKIPKGAAIIRPDNNDGPDIHLLLEEKGSGWRLELVIQAKLTEKTDGLTNTVLQNAVKSLDPDHYHMRFDQKVCTHPIVTLHIFPC